MSKSKPEIRAAEELRKYLDSTGRSPRRRGGRSIGRTFLFWDAPDGHQVRVAIERLARKGRPDLVRWRLPSLEITSLAVTREDLALLPWLVTLAEYRARFQPPYPEACKWWPGPDPPAGLYDPPDGVPMEWAAGGRRYGWTVRASQACQVRP